MILFPEDEYKKFLISIKDFITDDEEKAKEFLNLLWKFTEKVENNTRNYTYKICQTDYLKGHPAI